MKKINRIEPAFPVWSKQKKVAAYVRVSKNTKRLINSVSAQSSYYKNLIQSHSEWEYADLYVDCGISGTKVSKRSEFQRMLADCEAGKIDRIVTKSISRFARNTVDLLNVVRYLKSLGIGVWFEREQIDSLSKDGELLLSLLASFAQEESRSISENIKWGIRKRFQSGETGTANKHILGYQYDEEERNYVVIPEEAKIVQRIFARYLEGISLRKIAAELNEAGLFTVKGGKFTESSLNRIIQNEVYAGDIRRQKCLIEDPITKKKIPNKGQLPQYYITDCHEAILDRGTWESVQAERKKRAASVNPIYPFTGKIKCGICGRSFTRRKNKVKGKENIRWFCRAKKEAGRSCTSVNFDEEELKRIAAYMIGLKNFEETEFEKTVKKMIVQKNGEIEFWFFGGTRKVWKNSDSDFFRSNCFSLEEGRTKQWQKV